MSMYTFHSTLYDIRSIKIISQLIHLLILLVICVKMYVYFPQYNDPSYHESKYAFNIRNYKIFCFIEISFECVNYLFDKLIN